MLKLSQEQTAAVAAALAKVSYPPMHGDADGAPGTAAEAKQQLEKMMIPALQSVLSADQLQTYRQNMLKLIEEMAREREKFNGPASP